MKRIGFVKLVGVVTITGLLAALSVCGAASAHFSTTGVGTGSGLDGTLSAPTITSATAGAGTVQLTWSAVTPPAGAGAVRYYVSRSGGAPSGSCPTATAPGTGTSCTDSGLGKGTYSYTVTAVWQSWTATAAPATPVTLAYGAVTQLVFTTQPDGNATGGKAFPTQPVVTAEDAGGNIVTNYNGTISLSIKTGTGAGGATLSGCSGTLSNGVTAFSGCKIDKAGTGYQLTATDNTLTADSAPFTVAVGPPAQLLFTTQPDGNAIVGPPLPTQPKLTVEDAGGNIVTTDSSTVTLTITPGTPTAGGPGVLSGCTQTEGSGVISFSGCSINVAGNGYKLRAADNSLPAVDSAGFTVSTTAPTVAVTYPANNASYGTNWTGTITGTASANGGLSITSTGVSIEDATTGKWWSNGSFSTTTQAFVPASGTTAWTYAFPAGNLTSGHTYTVIGQATDSLGNVGTSGSVTFTYSAASVSVIGQGAAKSSTINGVKTTNGATDLIVIYCWGGSSCGSSGSTPAITGPFSSVSTQTIQSIVFNGNTKSCVEVVQAIGNGQTGNVTVSFSGGSADSVGFVNVLELSPGSTVKAVGTNPASQTVSTSPLATLGTTGGLSEIAIVGLDGNSGNDTITAPGGMSALTPLSGLTNPESSSTIGNAGGNLGMYFAPTAQASATFTLSPTAVDWGTIALGIG
jgi:trimeric autotransporter adhesin